MRSNDSSPVEQGALLLTRARPMVEVPLIWQAYRRGYGLVVLKTEAERRAEAAEARAAQAELKVRVLMEAIAGRTT